MWKFCKFLAFMRAPVDRLIWRAHRLAPQSGEFGLAVGFSVGDRLGLADGLAVGD
jgi:hypothetical protein